MNASLDPRAIKAAYARKLKRVRPDADPQGFQVLYQAYQQALELARDAPPRDDGDDAALAGQQAPAPVDAADRDSRHAPATLAAAAATPEASAVAAEDPRVTELAALLDQVEQVLACTARQDPAAWTFVASHPRILHPDFHLPLSLLLWDRLCRWYDGEEYAASDGSTVDVAVIRYLDSLFGWSERQDELRGRNASRGTEEILARLGDDDPDPDARALGSLRGAAEVLRRTATPEQPLSEFYYGSGPRRFLALLIDLLFLGLIVYGLLALLSVTTPLRGLLGADMLAGTTLAAYLFTTALLEPSQQQGSLGKQLLGLKVMRADFIPLSRWRSLGRALVFAVVYGSVAWLEPKLLLILMFINHWLHGRMIHDRLSGSVVVDWRRSLRERRRR